MVAVGVVNAQTFEWALYSEYTRTDITDLFPFGKKNERNVDAKSCSVPLSKKKKKTN